MRRNYSPFPGREWTSTRQSHEDVRPHDGETIRRPTENDEGPAEAGPCSGRYGARTHDLYGVNVAL